MSFFHFGKSTSNNTQKMKFSIKNFFSKRDQICSFQRIWSHLCKKSLMESSILCAVQKFAITLQSLDSFCSLSNFISNTFSTQAQYYLTFHELSFRCCLIQITIIILSRNLYIVYLCPYVSLGLFMSYLCDLVFIFSLIFIFINHMTSHCVKSVRTRSFSGPDFPAFRLHMERYSVSLRIQSECGKIRTRKTPNTNTFQAVSFKQMYLFFIHFLKYLLLFFGDNVDEESESFSNSKSSASRCYLAFA